jgi:hypothetical protein
MAVESKEGADKLRQAYLQQMGGGAWFAAYGPTGAVYLGLVSIFLGQRPLGHLDGVSTFLTVLGGVLVLAAAGARAYAFATSQGRRRQMDFTLLLCTAGILVALLIYMLSTRSGAAVLGITEDEALARWSTATTVIWLIVLAISIIPLTLVEITLGFAARYGSVIQGPAAEPMVESVRVNEAITNGLTVALALSFLMVTCNIAEERDVRWDVSYFRTSSPGTATQNVAASLNETLRVLLFFPDANEVATEAENYFRILDRAIGGKLSIERYDRLAEVSLAKEHKVNRDGTIVLLLGEKSEKLTLDVDMERARRTQLRELDQKVQAALMKVIRARRVAYFTVGRGELSDPAAERPLVAENPLLSKASMIKEWLRSLNYDVKDYEGFGRPVPEDASMLIILAPMAPLGDEDLRAIDEYLAKGGAALIALDPHGEASLGLLEGRLGVRFNPTPLADDKEFLRQRRQVSDHQYILTNQFSAHASVTTASRGQARAGIVLFNAGSLEDAPFTTGGQEPTRTYTVRSMNSTWRDLNGNFQFDEGTEQRSRYNVVAAIEDPSARPEKAIDAGLEERGMRVVVFSDAELFSDALMHPRAGLPLVQALVVDAIKWLGGEEAFRGETQDEKDVRIVHSRSEDAVYFYATIVVAPLVVLGLGLGWVFWHRRRSQRRRSS